MLRFSHRGYFRWEATKYSINPDFHCKQSNHKTGQSVICNYTVELIDEIDCSIITQAVTIFVNKAIIKIVSQ